MNVALYLRKSREEEQETREETLARHERILTDYCERHGLTVIKKYKKVGFPTLIASKLNGMNLYCFRCVVYAIISASFTQYKSYYISASLNIISHCDRTI